MYPSEINSNKIEGFWPNHSQLLLLKAALLTKKTALFAWQEWRDRNEGVKYSNLDLGSYRILPLIYKNLIKHGKKPGQIPRLKRIYDLVWKKNQLHFQNVFKVIRLTQKEDLPILLLKGLPLIITYYKDFGLRPMNDVDLLVSPEHVPKMIEILASQGLHANYGELDSLLLFRHSADFSDNDNCHIDLHWRLYPNLEGSNNKAEWKSADSFDYDGYKFYCLDSSDLFLLVCSHGARWHRIPPIRWIADATVIIETAKDSLDWEKIAFSAQKYNLVYKLRNIYEILLKDFHLPIPTNAINSLYNKEVKRWEIFEYYYTSKAIPVLWGVFDKFYYYKRTVAHKNVFFQLSNFFKYLRFDWKTETNWGLLQKILSLIFERIKLDIFTRPYFKRKPEKSHME